MSVHLAFTGVAAVLLLAVIAGVVWAVIVLRRTARDESGDAASGASSGPAVTPPDSEERSIILDMVRSGKITESEGVALLDAVDRKSSGQPKATRRSGNTGLIVGTLLCVIGFVMPWAHVHMMGIHGYQAGHQVGAIGWIILLLALVPVALVCIPPLGAAVNSALARVIASAIGGILAGGLLISLLSRRGDPGIGLFATVAGFIVLFVSGLRARSSRRV